MLSLSLGRLLKRDLWGPGKNMMSRGWGCLPAGSGWEPPGRALPYSQGTGRAETQSARPHPPGTFVSPRRSWDHLRAAEGAGKTGSAHPHPHPSQRKGRLEEGVGDQPGEGRQGQRTRGKREGSLVPRAERRFDLGFESQKMRSWVWGGREAPTSGGKPLNRFCYVWPQQFP